MAWRSKAGFCGRSLVGATDSNPIGPWVSVRVFERCVLSSRDLCDGPTSPEEFYRVCAS
jgi:hypothetical protein